MNKLNYLMRPVVLAGVFASVMIFTACEDVRVENYPSGKVRSETTYVKDKKEGPE